MLYTIYLNNFVPGFYCPTCEDVLKEDETLYMEFEEVVRHVACEAYEDYMNKYSLGDKSATIDWFDHVDPVVIGTTRARCPLCGQLGFEVIEGSPGEYIHKDCKVETVTPEQLAKIKKAYPSGVEIFIGDLLDPKSS